MSTTIELPEELEQKLREEYEDLESEMSIVVGLHFYHKEMIGKEELCQMLGVSQSELASLLIERDPYTRTICIEVPNAEDTALAKIAADTLAKSYHGGELKLRIQNDDSLEDIILPERIAKLFVFILTEMGKGSAIRLQSYRPVDIE